MGAKIKVRDGESMPQAMRRLRKVIEQWFRHPLCPPRPSKKAFGHRQKPCEVRHHKRSLAATRRRENFNRTLKAYGLR